MNPRPHTVDASCREANFPDAEIVRCKGRGGHGPRAGLGGGPGEICHCISY